MGQHRDKLWSHTEPGSNLNSATLLIVWFFEQIILSSQSLNFFLRKNGTNITNFKSYVGVK